MTIEEKIPFNFMSLSFRNIYYENTHKIVDTTLGSSTMSTKRSNFRNKKLNIKVEALINTPIHLNVFKLDSIENKQLIDYGSLIDKMSNINLVSINPPYNLNPSSINLINLQAN